MQVPSSVKNFLQQGLAWRKLASDRIQRSIRAEWRQVQKPRFYLSAALTGLVCLAIGNFGVEWMQQAKPWNRVYANGSYVGLVPETSATRTSIERVAAGYHVNVHFASIHQSVPTYYNWREVESLPTRASAIQVNGHTVVYIKSRSQARLVLDRVESLLSPKRIVKGAQVHFRERVNIAPAVVGVAQVLSADSAVRRILYPSVAHLSARGQSLAFIRKPTRHNATRIGAQSGSFADVASSARMPAIDHPLIHLVVTEVVPHTLRVPAPIHYVPNDRWPVGKTTVISGGKPGVVREHVRLHFVDGSLKAMSVAKRRFITKPITEVIERGTNDGVATGPWIWPTTWYDITSPFGPRQLAGYGNFHPGVDIGCPIGTPIFATNDGVVEDAGWNSGGYGYWVKINNGNGIETVFGHMSRVVAVAGSIVSKGQLIGYSGDTGDATGPHLHYEVRMYGRAVPPTPYM